MTSIPTKRFLVYVISGLVVLAVGTGAVVSMRGGSSSASGVAISAGGDRGGSAALTQVSPGMDPASAAAVTEPSTTTEPPTIYVQVAGAVRRPGVYEMSLEARVFQAVQQAGGFAADADEQAVTLAAQLSDGCRIYVPRVGEVVVEPSPASGGPAPEGTAEGQSPVSINSAGPEELDSLPGIGPAIAQDIVTYRETNGPFTSVEQLTDVPGIGPSKLEQLRPLVTL